MARTATRLFELGTQRNELLKVHQSFQKLRSIVEKWKGASRWA